MTDVATTVLAPAWNCLAEYLQLSADQSDAAFADLIARYQEPQRHFHTLDHLEGILNFLKPEQYPPRDAALLIAATFWHDAVYETASIEAIRDNEKNSAVLAYEQLKDLGAPENFIEDVTVIILATKTHDIDAESNAMGARFLDADIVTLAGTPEQYNKGCVNVYKEYSIIPPQDFYQGRLNLFLYPMLEKNSIFLLPENEERLGEQARTNLKREAQTLETLLKPLSRKLPELKP